MLKWQKDLLKRLDLSTDMDRIIGRRIRCRFQPIFLLSGGKKIEWKDAIVMVRGVRFDDGYFQLLLDCHEASKKQDGGISTEAYLESGGSGWRFHGFPVQFGRYEDTPNTTVTWL